MSNTSVAHGITIVFEHEPIPMVTMSGELVPDRSWKHFDSHGHAHAFDGDELPTLEYVITGTRSVGDEYGSVVEVGEYRCRVCEEVVVPKFNRDTSVRYIPGPPRRTLQIGDSSWPINEKDAGDLCEIMARVTRGESRD